MQSYYIEDAEAEYYNLEKNKIVALIPKGPHIVFDLGCATGRLGRKLLDLGKASVVIGAEIHPKAAIKARQYYDTVYIGDLETLEFQYKDFFDFIVCGDIIEHLRDPWKMLERIHRWLKRGGRLIMSIPNVRYWKIWWDLIIWGKWEYVEAGILDRTHLRFFTRSSCVRILESAGLDIVSNRMVIHGKRKNKLNKLTFSLFEEFLGSQMLLVASKRR